MKYIEFRSINSSGITEHLNERTIMPETAIVLPPDDRLLSLHDLAAFIGVAKRTLQSWRANGELPAPDLKVGKTVRWRRSTIEQWITTR